MLRRRHAGRGWRRLGRIALVLLLLPTFLILLFRFVPPPVTPLMLWRLVEGEGLDKDWTAFAAISPHLARAVIAAEDNRFCEHHGIDWPALRHEIGRAWAGEHARGASTISMQTTKNVLLWPGRDPVRKVLEAALTPQLELLWGKRRIMEVYLNVAETGPGIYGAEAAARRFFKKPAARLTRHEAALIAAVLPNPRRWSPQRPTRYIAQRARMIERRMEQLGPLLDCVR
ncbi:monofunctional biosynthetic peptidoglycan transglycosylase [Benzoatithermus flavus]|uniref:Biosynthetic peptidoglycan transglycosylase n=1 Tax=Benzoatithermus flavus TaxID=3108223 RepID=A0ABU8XQJ0_9PROT